MLISFSLCRLQTASLLLSPSGITSEKRNVPEIKVDTHVMRNFFTLKIFIEIKEIVSLRTQTYFRLSLAGNRSVSDFKFWSTLEYVLALGRHFRNIFILLQISN